MRTPGRTIAAIDVGTTKIFTVVAEVHATGDIKLLGHSAVPCAGLRKGNVEDVVATTEAIRNCVSQVRKKTGKKIRSAYIGVTGSHVTFENKKYAFSSVGATGVITGDDVRDMSQHIMASTVNGKSLRIAALFTQFLWNIRWMEREPCEIRSAYTVLTSKLKPTSSQVDSTIYKSLSSR